MGRPKAALEWHGSTLLHRIVGIVGRVVDGPLVVVKAPGQELPELPGAVRVVSDAREGRGPLQGLAAGLSAAAEARWAYVSSTDVPLLHPAFIAVVLRAAQREDVDVALPVAHGFRHPLAAVYRTAVLPEVERLIAEDLMKPGLLLQRVQVLELDEAELLRDRALAAADAELLSLLNVNDPAEYERVRARPAPAVTVRCLGALGRDDRGDDPLPVRAATLGAAAAAAGVELEGHVVPVLNGEEIARDPCYPLAGGDAVAFSAAAAGT
jgi:molybdenum cofactor guanylyltransferase